MKHRDVALAILVSAIWGVNFVVIHVGLDSMSPLLFCALRFGAAALPAVLLVGRPKVPWRWVVATGVALGVVKFSLLFAGMAAGLPSGLSALVLQSQVVFTLIFAMVLLGDRPGRRRFAGVALSGAGIVLIASQLGLDRPVGAFLLVVAAGAAWGLANIAMRKAQAADMLNFMVWVSAVATPPLVVLTLSVDGPSAVWHSLRGLDLTAFGAIAYIAYLSTLFGFGVWGRLIARYDAATVAPFAALAPVFALLSSALLLGERLHWYDAAGGAAILGGVLLGAVRVRREPPPEPAAGAGRASRTAAGTAA
ncbi:EamA family transporter [Dactylosporangium maewongense]|uniref:EamA family transporter n=1 Tax=Dactylosporangium maewongense TaxID=634393 RepID=A0ABN2AQ80_9ACTN